MKGKFIIMSNIDFKIKFSRPFKFMEYTFLTCFMKVNFREFSVAKFTLCVISHTLWERITIFWTKRRLKWIKMYSVIAYTDSLYLGISPINYPIHD